MLKIIIIGSFILLLAGHIFARQTQKADSSMESQTILIKKVIPSSKNPHPPLNEQDQKRVKFAQELLPLFWNQKIDQNQLAKLIKQPQEPNDYDPKKSPDDFHYVNKPLACLKDISCWSKDYPFLKQVEGIQSQSNVFFAPKILHLHVVPWSLRRFEQRNLPEAQQTLNDDLKILEAQKNDYASTQEPLAFQTPIHHLKKDEYLVDAIIQFKGTSGWWNLNMVMTEDADGEVYFRHFILDPIQDLTKQTIYLH